MVGLDWCRDRHRRLQRLALDQATEEGSAL